MKFFASLIITLSSFSQAKEVVSINWGYKAGAQVVVPSSDLKRRLKKNCNIEVPSHGRRTKIPVEALQCPDLLEHFQESQNQIVKLQKKLRTLTSFGITHVLDIPLKKLTEFIPKVKIKLFRWGIFESLREKSGKPRQTGVVIPSENLIIINHGIYRLIHAPKNDFDLFLLHELITALGYTDAFYQKSLLIWWLFENPNDYQKLQDFIHEYKIRVPESIQHASGATVVGHGGEFEEILFKGSLLKSTKTLVEIRDENNELLISPNKYERIALILASEVVRLPSDMLIQASPYTCTSHQDPHQISAEHCAFFTFEGLNKTPTLFFAEGWASQPPPQIYSAIEKALIEITQQWHFKKSTSK